MLKIRLFLPQCEIHLFSGSLSSLKNIGEEGIDYEHIAIQFQPPSKIKTTLEYNCPYPGHLKRHSFIPRDLDLDRYVIFCDTDDVVFQTKIPKLSLDMYLAPENVTHRDTIWQHDMKDFRDFDVLMDKPVINCGMYILKVSVLYQYLDFLKENEDHPYNSHGFEQPWFNLFLYKHPELTRSEDLSIMCPLYDNMSRVTHEDTWKVNGKTIFCVHENGIKGRL